MWLPRRTQTTGQDSALPVAAIDRSPEPQSQCEQPTGRSLASQNPAAVICQRVTPEFCSVSATQINQSQSPSAGPGAKLKPGTISPSINTGSSTKTAPTQPTPPLPNSFGRGRASASKLGGGNRQKSHFAEIPGPIALHVKDRLTMIRVVQICRLKRTGPQSLP